MHFYLAVSTECCIFTLYKNKEIMSNLVKTTIQKSDLQIGMTVELNGHLRTVGRENLKNTPHG